MFLGFLLEKIAKFIGGTILFLLISSAILGPKGALVLVMSVYAAMLIAGIYTAILAIIVVGIIVIVLEIGDIKNKINVLKI